MAREDWRRRDEERGWRTDPRQREDFGQADYSDEYGYDPEHRTGYPLEARQRFRDGDYRREEFSTDYAYDPEGGRGYRRFYRDDRTRETGDADDYDRPGREHRSWRERAGGLFTGHRDEEREERRGGPSDRVLWAIIVERLEDERRLDLSDVEVVVDNAEVTLNGTVRRKEDKRRIEDVADIEGVRNVQNNLRPRERGRGWSFL